MKKISARIKDGKIELDFDGFQGNACEQEEVALRLTLGKMGVKTDVTDDKRKAEREPNHTREREKS